MILGINELLRLVKEEKLIEGLSERELNTPEGTGFDLRIGRLNILKGNEGFLGVKERATPKLELVAEYKTNEPMTIVIQPDEYYLMTTIEKVNTPNNLAGLFRPRTTLFRSGLTLYTGICSPGYCGELSFGLVNHSKFPFKLEMGARVVHVTFHTVEGLTNLYKGQWQGGRETTNGKKETQV